MQIVPSVPCLNGLRADIFRPVERRRHDASLLAEWNLSQLQQPPFASDNSQISIFGDPA